MKIINDESTLISILEYFRNDLFSLKNDLINLKLFSEKVIKYGNAYLYEEKGIKKGFIIFYSNDLESKRGFLSMIAVKKIYRNEHIGSEMLEFCERFCLEKGMEELFLEVMKTNDTAVNFYKNKAYVFVEENNNKYIMKKLLRKE